MATKKTTTTAKTKTKKPTTKKSTVKKTVAKKTSAKVSKPVPKTVHATEPYHPVFGIILLVVCIIMASFLIAWGCCSYVKSKTDAAKFAAEYTEVSEKNVYAIKDGEEIIDILEDGTGVVFLGYPACPWCQRYAAMLNDMAKEYGIKDEDILGVLVEFYRGERHINVNRRSYRAYSVFICAVHPIVVLSLKVKALLCGRAK